MCILGWCDSYMARLHRLSLYFMLTILLYLRNPVSVIICLSNIVGFFPRTMGWLAKSVKRDELWVINQFLIDSGGKWWQWQQMMAVGPSFAGT